MNDDVEGKVSRQAPPVSTVGLGRGMGLLHLNASFESIDQGNPTRGELLSQQPEEHGALVSFLGSAQAVEEPGLEIEDVPELLLTVHFCKTVFGFI